MPKVCITLFFLTTTASPAKPQEGVMEQAVVSAKLSSSLSNILPPIVRELQEFPEKEYAEIHSNYVNNLYVYPEMVDISSKGAKNVGVRVELRAFDNHASEPLKVSFKTAYIPDISV